MARSYNYSIAQFRTDPGRDERLNVGILLFTDTGVEVRLPRSLDKLRAISNAVDLELVRDSLENLKELDAFVRNEGLTSIGDRLSSIRVLTSLHLTQVGVITAPSNEMLETQLNTLLMRLVQPEPAPPRINTRRSTKLLSNVKAAFRSERVLARPGEDLSSHRVVAGFRLAEGLSADLLLKNGAMHVVQTVDAVFDDGASRRAVYDIGLSALVFEQARMSFGEQQNARLVYQASSGAERLVTPALQAAEHQGAKLINWESRDDRTRFVVEISSLAEPLATRTGRNMDAVHASKQGKLSIH